MIYNKAQFVSSKCLSEQYFNSTAYSTLVQVKRVHVNVSYAYLKVLFRGYVKFRHFWLHFILQCPCYTNTLHV